MEQMVTCSRETLLTFRLFISQAPISHCLYTFYRSKDHLKTTQPCWNGKQQMKSIHQDSSSKEVPMDRTSKILALSLQKVEAVITIIHLLITMQFISPRQFFTTD